MGVNWSRCAFSTVVLLALATLLLLLLDLQENTESWLLAATSIIIFNLLIELAPQAITDYVTYHDKLANIFQEYHSSFGIPIMQLSEDKLAKLSGHERISSWIDEIRKSLNDVMSIEGSATLRISGSALSGKTLVAQQVFAWLFMKWDASRHSPFYKFRKRRIPVYVFAEHVRTHSSDSSISILEKIFLELRRILSNNLKLDLFIDSKLEIPVDVILRTLGIQNVEGIRIILISRRTQNKIAMKTQSITIGNVSVEEAVTEFKKTILKQPNISVNASEIDYVVECLTRVLLKTPSICTLPIISRIVLNLSTYLGLDDGMEQISDELLQSIALNSWSNLIWQSASCLRQVSIYKIEDFKYTDGSTWLTADSKSMRIVPAAIDFIEGKVIKPPINAEITSTLTDLERDWVICGDSGSGKTTLAVGNAFELWKLGNPVIFIRRDTAHSNNSLSESIGNMAETMGVPLIVIIDDVNLVPNSKHLIKYKHEITYFLTIRNESVIHLKQILGLQQLSHIPKQNYEREPMKRTRIIETGQYEISSVEQMCENLGWNHFSIPKDSFHRHIGLKVIEHISRSELNSSEKNLVLKAIHETKYNLVLLSFYVQLYEETFDLSVFGIGLQDAIYRYIKLIASKHPESIRGNPTILFKIGTILSEIAPLSEYDIPIARKAIISSTRVNKVLQQDEITELLDWLISQGELVVTVYRGWQFYTFSHAQIAHAVVDQLEVTNQENIITLPGTENKPEAHRKDTLQRYATWLVNEITVQDPVSDSVYRQFVSSIFKEFICELGSTSPLACVDFLESNQLHMLLNKLSIHELASLLLDLRQRASYVDIILKNSESQFDTFLRERTRSYLGLEENSRLDLKPDLFVDLATLVGTWWMSQSGFVDEKAVISILDNWLNMESTLQPLIRFRELNHRDPYLAIKAVYAFRSWIDEAISTSSFGEILDFVSNPSYAHLDLRFSLAVPLLNQEILTSTPSDVFLLIRGISRYDWETSYEIVNNNIELLIDYIKQANGKDIGIFLSAISNVDRTVFSTLIDEAASEISIRMKELSAEALGHLLYSFIDIKSSTVSRILRENIEVLKENVSRIEPESAHGILVGLHAADPKLAREIVKTSKKSLNLRLAEIPAQERANFLRYLSIADFQTASDIVQKNTELLESTLSELDNYGIGRFFFEISDINMPFASDLLEKYEETFTTSIQKNLVSLNRTTLYWFNNLKLASDSIASRILDKLGDDISNYLNKANIDSCLSLLRGITTIDREKAAFHLKNTERRIAKQIELIKPNIMIELLYVMANISHELTGQLVKKWHKQFERKLVVLSPDDSVQLLSLLIPFSKDWIHYIDVVKEHLRRANTREFSQFLRSILLSNREQAEKYVQAEYDVIMARVVDANPGDLCDFLLTLIMLRGPSVVDEANHISNSIHKRMGRLTATNLHNIVLPLMMINISSTRVFVTEFKIEIEEALIHASYYGLNGVLKILSSSCAVLKEILTKYGDYISQLVQEANAGSVAKLFEDVKQNCPDCEETLGVSLGIEHFNTPPAENC